jgi:hypothetical protein
MDKYNLEHMVEKEMTGHEVNCEHVQHEEEREEEAEQKPQPMDIHQEEG